MLDEVGGKDFVLKRGNYAGTPVGSWTYSNKDI
jgi:hypothetical protein